eukprot:TRINITY_DN21510_c0_g1_i1.p1 TRINITY_DN21510_c0_g1~~TRINITY_DN21510_c0_g1_i1.p1  ORF type:complete len:298 (+),score=64.46 TRINITY_DN21510_c0_g1_i1:56-895(+)
MNTQDIQLPPNYEQKGGFNFDLVQRNNYLTLQGIQQPTAKKTGTTIVGLVYQDGIVLGADTRATEGSIVADKNCEKIHYIAPNIYCCGAGTSADTENTTALVSSQLELHRMATLRQSRVVTAKTMLKQFLFKYQGNISAALVLGGVDVHGPQLHTVYPHGSTDSLPYVTMGSGSLAAMAVFEAHYKPNMTRQEGIDLVQAAIHAGIFNDLGSGGNVDVTVITKDNTEILRNYDKPNPRKYRREVVFPKGSTRVISQSFTPFNQEIDLSVPNPSSDKMET